MAAIDNGLACFAGQSPASRLLQGAHRPCERCNTCGSRLAGDWAAKRPRHLPAPSPALHPLRTEL